MDGVPGGTGRRGCRAVSALGIDGGTAYGFKGTWQFKGTWHQTNGM
jgi:hypothetical protein